MRITLRIDDDVLAAARSLARRQGRTVGEMISMLARKGLDSRVSVSGGGARLPIFEVGPGAPALTSEMVREALG
jgi:hypothetical protein